MPLKKQQAKRTNKQRKHQSTKHQLTNNKQPRKGNGTMKSGHTVMNGHHKSHVAFWVGDVKGKVGILLDFGGGGDIGDVW